MASRFERRSSSAAAVLAVAFLAALAPTAGVGAVGSPAATAPANATGAAQPVEVDSCRTIAAPGSYVLAGNLTDAGRDVCLRIESSDVVLNGSGHAVDGASTSDGVGVLVAAGGTGSLRNVTVRNLRATDWATGVAVGRVTDGELWDVDAVGNRVGVELRATNETRVVDLVGTGNDGDGVRVSDSTNATVRNATVADNGGNGVAVVRSTVVTVRDAVAAGNDGAGVELAAVEDAVLADSEVMDNRRAGVRLAGSSRVSVVASNVSRNAVGVRFADGGATEVIVQTSRLVANDGGGVGVGGESVNVSVRLNAVLDNAVGVRLGSSVAVDTVAILGNVLAGNDRFGVLNEAPGVVVATRNDWGSTDGPSSAPPGDADAPFADPDTGRLANGSGDAVSEHPDRPGVSNVRFDPVASRRAASPFPSPLEASVGDTTFVVGPPRDLDGNGTYEDVTGDGTFDGQDVAALQVLVRAVAADGLSLSDAQVAALDFDGDGELGAGDVEALAEEVGREP